MNSLDDFVLGKEQEKKEEQGAPDSLEDLVLGNAQKAAEERAAQAEAQRQRAEEKRRQQEQSEARERAERKEAEARARREAEAREQAARAEAEAAAEELARAAREEEQRRWQREQDKQAAARERAARAEAEAKAAQERERIAREKAQREQVKQQRLETLRRQEEDRRRQRQETIRNTLIGALAGAIPLGVVGYCVGVGVWAGVLAAVGAAIGAGILAAVGATIGAVVGAACVKIYGTFEIVLVVPGFVFFVVICAGEGLALGSKIGEVLGFVGFIVGGTIGVLLFTWGVSNDIKKAKKKQAAWNLESGYAQVEEQRQLAEERRAVLKIPDDFVFIQGGTFTMGSPKSEMDREPVDTDETQHRVTVTGFYMGKYEITQQEYEAVMGINPSHFQGANLPVEQVSWFDAVAYCNARSQRESLSLAYKIVGKNVTWNRSANGYRLPTEAEWEYACRAGTIGPFSTGNNITTSQANYNGNYPYNNNAKGIYREKTTDVGSFASNPWGLYDMHGNVSEWCWDWYGAYSMADQTDLSDAASGSYRVLRGGSWFDSAQNLRSARRNCTTPLSHSRYSNRSRYIGFRVVRP
jgi:formylglycine-generating enzyme required for sulfatase activity